MAETRGRKSKTQLQTEAQLPVHREERPAPPIELTGEQADVWWEAVDHYPADQFIGKESLLADYCRHVISQRRLSQLIDALVCADDFDEQRYLQLLDQQRKESKTKITVARAIGIALKSTYEPKNPNRGKKAPWQYEG